METDRHYPFRLTDFLDTRSLQDLQGGCCALGEMSGVILDGEGTVLTQPIWAGDVGGESERAALLESMIRCGKQANVDQMLIRADGPGGAAIVASAIVMEGEPLGVIVLAGQKPADRAPDFLRSFCDTLSRFCHQEHQLRHRVDELSTMHDVAGMLAGRSDLQEILGLTGSRVVEVMGVKACSIRLLDESTGQLTVKAVYNLSEEYLNKGPVLVQQNPIDSAALAGQTVYVEDAPSDPRTRYPAQARAEGLVSSLVVGMIYRARPVGVIRVYTGQKHRFSGFEALLLRAIASQTAAAIVNAQLLEDKMATDRYAQQMQYAGQVQRRMIPALPPTHAHAEFGCVYEPTLEVGGDFYDFIELPRGHVGMAIADVVGKGAPASVMMASIRSALRVYAHNTHEINEIISHVNRHLCRDTLASEFATLFYGVLSPDGSTLTYCNAGHEPPLLLRDGAITWLEEGGLVIGVSKDEVYRKQVLQLQRGDVVLLSTDGMAEAMNFEDECFGRKRLAESLRRYHHLRGSQIAQNVLWDVRRFVGLADQADDITLVSMKMR